MLISKRDLSVEASRSRAFLIFRVYIYSVMVKPVSDLKRADNWLRLKETRLQRSAVRTFSVKCSCR